MSIVLQGAPETDSLRLQHRQETLEELRDARLQHRQQTLEELRDADGDDKGLEADLIEKLQKVRMLFLTYRDKTHSSDTFNTAIKHLPDTWGMGNLPNVRSADKVRLDIAIELRDIATIAYNYRSSCKYAANLYTPIAQMIISNLL